MKWKRTRHHQNGQSGIEQWAEGGCCIVMIDFVAARAPKLRHSMNELSREIL